MTDKVVAKIKDKKLIELAHKLLGLQSTIKLLSQELGRTEIEFWLKASKKYKLDIPLKRYVLDYINLSIIEKEDC